ncbi:MAG: DUF1553 domain-containing protein [Pedosphaera sp.]|nr:DUF1553 domain-containing protein [Pedosphaera sp.]
MRTIQMNLTWTFLLIAVLLQEVTNAAVEKFGAGQPNHWAFQKPVQPVVPESRPGSGAARHPIDAFIHARLQRDGLAPAPEADRFTLLRRVCLDLKGLPPSPEEVDLFLKDTAPDAYERLVERLLGSPHYGERWGRWWLDAARYADSNGYSIDSLRSMWPYRDWVVRALNSDLPFDQFTIWQLAGDLLPTSESPDAKPQTSDPIVATGFHRNTQVNHEGGIDTEQFRIESAMDRVNTTATVWLGITLGCAQCHDHKYDPFTQKDYYRFFAFFNQQENDGHGSPALEAENTLDLGTPEELAALAKHREELKAREKELNDWLEKELKPRQAAWESALDDEAKKKLKPEVLAAIAAPAKDRNEFQIATAFNAFRDQDADHRERRKGIDELRKQRPKVPTALVMKEHSKRRETHVMVKGDFTRLIDKVEAGTPVVLGEFRSGGGSPLQAESQKDAGASTGPRSETGSKPPEGRAPTRLDLAQWLVSQNNPLTARVIMNRVWQVYFGKGLVETENDFGRMGTPPSHPELLDWLATEFVSRGWSLKAMHRLIVTSTTYRQSSKSRPELAMADSSNKLLTRQNRLRLDAELIRDVHLVASGLLDPRLGGPPVFPPQPLGIDAFTQNKREWKPSTGGDRYRRALYTHLQRTTLHPALAVFDSADTYVTCTRRLRSNTPLQALTLLNDQQFVELAQGLASRIQARGGDNAARIEFAFQCCVARKPTPAERERLAQLLSEEEKTEANGAMAWLTVARVLLNLDETITRE